MGIGRRIKVAVDALGLSLKHAAEKSELSYSSMQNWTGGHRDPRPDALLTLGSRLGISIDWLLTGEGAMFRGQTSGSSLLNPASPREEALLALWRELDETDQQEVHRVAEGKKRLATLEQRLMELEAVVADGKRLA